LEPKEIPIHFAASVYLEGLSQEMNKLGRIGTKKADRDDLFIHLGLCPCEQILTKEKHKEKEQAKSVKHPKEFPPQNLAYSDPGDTQDGK
jgi:hypothetical protein